MMGLDFCCLGCGLPPCEWFAFVRRDYCIARTTQTNQPSTEGWNTAGSLVSGDGRFPIAQAATNGFPNARSALLCGAMGMVVSVYGYGRFGNL